MITKVHTARDHGEKILEESKDSATYVTKTDKKGTPIPSATQIRLGELFLRLFDEFLVGVLLLSLFWNLNC